jgi:transporter family-2 protein
VVSWRPLRQAAASLPRLVRERRLPWWTLTAGIGGATYVTAQSLTVAVIGVALFTVCTVAGQTGTGLLVDRLGIGPTGQVAVSARRVAAAVVATVAVAVAAWGRGGSGDDAHDVGRALPAFVLLAVAAGAAGTFQVAFNGRVSAATGRPAVAALVNFAVGLCVLIGVLALEHRPGGRSWPQLPAPTGDHGWVYLGGVLGVFFVLSSAWAVRTLGVLLFSLVLLSGTLVTALLLDALVPTGGTRVTGWLLVGVFLTLASVALAVGRSQRPAREARTP